MGCPLPQVKLRKKLLIAVVVALALLVGSIIFRIQAWNDDAFIGNPVSVLENHLRTRSHQLEWADPTGFQGHTGRQLKGNQRVMRFVKHQWLPGGGAYTLGYVVIESKPEGEIVVDIVSSFQIDGP